MLVRDSSGAAIGICDDTDSDLLAGWKFSLAADSDGRRYVHARRGGECVPLHRLLLDPPAELMVDHVNGDGTDNRRANIRVATNSQNQANTSSRGGSSRFKGVYLRKKDGRYVAGLAKKFLGSFDLEVDAARCYDEAARERWGPFARTNFAP